MLTNFNKYAIEKIEYKSKIEQTKYILRKKGKQKKWNMRFRNNINKEICSSEFNSIEDFENNFNDIEKIIKIIDSIPLLKKSDCILKLKYDNNFYISISFNRSFWDRNVHYPIHEEYKNIPIDLTNLDSLKLFLTHLLYNMGFSANKDYVVLNISKNFVDILDKKNSFIELNETNIKKAKIIKGHEIDHTIQFHIELLSFIPEEEIKKIYHSYNIEHVVEDVA